MIEQPADSMAVNVNVTSNGNVKVIVLSNGVQVDGEFVPLEEIASCCVVETIVGWRVVHCAQLATRDGSLRTLAIGRLSAVLAVWHAVHGLLQERAGASATGGH